ncbi:TonB-dependent receptor [Acidicapsa acidisoli]|uniref:TonB-dependent receptor n=1 Tax=Acidicapsa acidisoli TaxID=1615681 RepID=UPI0021E02E1F|nr:carboxypeptidase-like regulatory domain-containing protein [Acidicapsa acidisoli]
MRIRRDTKRLCSLGYWSGFAALLAILATASPWGNAQIATTTATLSGVVSDPSGAIVPNASVTLDATEKAINRTFITDAGGRYSFSQLPPATYKLTIKINGFETYEQKGIALNAAESATQNVSLTIGAESQSVVVTADASELNTDNSNVAASLDAKEIVELPLNVRNIYGLTTLNSSVSNTSESQMLLGGGSNTTDNADQDISFLNFNGGFFGTTAFMLDGSWDTDPEWGAVIFVPSVDGVQQFKIQNNSFTAQYGWSTGNVVNVVTKSGTRNFHGSAYEFYADNGLNALNYFSTSSTSLTRNQTGVSAGGPLYIPGLYRQRDKTFVFGLYEHFTVTTPTVVQYAVPDANFRAGNFSEILGAPTGKTDALGRPILLGQIYDPHSGRHITAGAVDPVTGLTASQTGYIRDPIKGNILSNLAGYAPDPIGAKLLSYYPCPTCTGTGNNYTVSASAPASSNEYSIRADHNFSSQATGYFRYSYKQEEKTGAAAAWGSDAAGPGNERPNNRWGAWAGLTQIFSPTFTMNITSGVQLWHETSNNQSFGFNSTSNLGLPSYLTSQYPLFPIVDVGSVSSMGPLAGNQQGVTNHGPIGTVGVDFIKLHGKNTLNFGFMGVEQMDSQKLYYQTTLDFSGNFTSGPDPLSGSGFANGNGVAQMLLGVLDSAGGGTSVGTIHNLTVSNRLLGEYVQDDWRPFHNLTVNLGLRYEVQTPDTYRNNEGSIFNPNALNPLSYTAGQPVLGALEFLSPGNRDVYNPNYTNIAPRVGFSYQPIAKAVVHGGYGIFFPQSVTCCFPADPDGFSATTYINPSLDGGVTPNPNISTSNPWGGVYAQITGNKNGEYQQLGNGLTSTFSSRRSPYVQQWMLGVQYAISPSDELEIDYIGNRGVRMIGSMNYNQLNPTYLPMGSNYLGGAAASNPFAAPLKALEAGGSIAPSGCNLDNASATNAQLLSPYPQYCNGGVAQTDAPVGQSLYNALQVTYNHRVSKGLTAMVSYTYSKFLDNVAGNNAWSYNGPTNWGVTPANNYNLAADKSVDGGDIPQSLVASYSYQLPIGRGKAVGSGINRIADAVVGGWELSGIASFKAGIPLGIFGNDQPSYGGNPRPDVIANPKMSHHTIHEWFNTGAFTYAPYGSFGDAPRYFSDLRGPRFQDWDTVLAKNWNFRETMRAQFRFETFNTFNHPNFYAPGAGSTSYSGCDPNATGCASSFGQITNAFPGRIVQWAGKFYW